MVERFLVSRSDGPLAQLHRLEWRYDGPVPAEALSALDVAPTQLARRRAAADSHVLDGLAREAVRRLAAARRRATGAQLQDLERHDAVPRLAHSRRAGLAQLDQEFRPL